ncbi:hypothetical protein [Turneriella parva]|uniref:Uncharacterized protein n=1 Tax=Turneriella parva (strain ATCC BAA-1111 / DSM 21527 / NCTC 11395 / H) TaxID=869212 RepID=I4B2G8_TURPD|nr:hypothetical protein [Turneriella parva]AFM11475.1 hypothetical protein Turpa_0824 [Turneriella parva DSM 21527]
MLLSADYLNEHCHCSTLDKSKIEHAHYFSEHPHFLSLNDLHQMQTFIEAHERLTFYGLTPVEGKRIERGIFNSYDFHISDNGPQLIEINTNAAGALLGLHAEKEMMQCCEGLPGYLSYPGFAFDSVKIVDMFRREFALRFPGRPLGRVAIVDENPGEQFFYSEFVLVQQMLQSHGIDAVIVTPEALSIRENVAYANEIPLDFIYNRLTDFAFEQPSSATLKQIYEQGLATVSPNPAVHALYANKANLTLFWSDAATNMPQTDLATVRAHLPETVFVTAANADLLWSQKKEWFFKPLDGYGGKGVYRGDKLTTKVWQHIIAGNYIAQRYVAPRTRQVSGETSLKYDVRVYTYAGEILGLMARYYQGQTTNFRTEHGGLAGVLVMR